METQTKLNEVMELFVEYAPVIKELFNEDVDITVTDRKQVLEQLLSKELNVQSSKGRILNDDEPMIEVIRKNKSQSMYIPKEYYGCPFTATMVPISDKSGKVIGGISVSRSTRKQEQLSGVAQQFASSSEEISASTEQLAASSKEFDVFMSQLAKAQHEMQRQVENTTKILEMINVVAKNTRILGFNAGIEAARSGEFGRGFSVVAKEITKLADQSADSVNEIRQHIAQLNEKVDEVASIVNQSVVVSQDQSTSIDDISKSVQQLTDVAEKIEDMANNI